MISIMIHHARTHFTPISSWRKTPEKQKKTLSDPRYLCSGRSSRNPERFREFFTSGNRSSGHPEQRCPRYPRCLVEWTTRTLVLTPDFRICLTKAPDLLALVNILFDTFVIHFIPHHRYFKIIENIWTYFNSKLTSQFALDGVAETYPMNMNSLYPSSLTAALRLTWKLKQN